MGVDPDVGEQHQDFGLLCEQIRMIDKTRIMPVLGHLEEPYLGELAIALQTILGLG